ncbi:MAG: methyltransferase domain-containing protein [Acidobacteria bacterium]|nr:methyltransferase domain-containing protein [Acidobacteriota bacterium]HMQ04373.1 methyltransferase domain-containing protein [Pyrinomonadaceae bacterium]
MNYIPALGYDWLTPLYDPVVRLTSREAAFKRALVEQSRPAAGQQILDLACGTGTLALLLKGAEPQTDVFGIDGDPKILKIAAAKANNANADIRFDEAMSFDLPYADASFDRVFSSLFFHHLTWEKKMKTLEECLRVLRIGGELHVADWGLPANPMMRIASGVIRLLDGAETTSDSFEGRLPTLIRDVGFERVEETNYYNTLFGTIRLHRARKPWRSSG